MQTKKQVILLSSYFINDYVISAYDKLQASLRGDMDMYLLIEVKSDYFTISERIKYFPFTIDTLNELSYIPIAEAIIPGSNHFQLFQFYRTFPQYDYYWNIEYDVYMNGEWRLLFDRYKTVASDFISSHIERYPQTPEWMWWDSLQLKTIDIPKVEYVKSFNPIYRISNKAMALLDKVLSEGNAGHHEVMIPTVLNYLGYTINDWGGIGEFVIQGNENSVYLTSPDVNNYYYLGSTMRFRPEFNRAEVDERLVKNRVYHPVKK